MKALSPTDSLFLWMETRSQPMHVAGLNIYTPPKGAGPDFVARLVAQWSESLKALPPFNQRPVLKLGLWYWDTDKHFELDYHLRHVALPHPGRIRELLAMVSRVHANLMDRNRPLWEMYVIEGLPGGRFATYTKIHHALMDGVSGARVTAGAHATSAQEQKPPMWAQRYPGIAGGSRAHGVAPGIVDQIIGAARAGKDILPGIGSGLWDILKIADKGSAAALPFHAPPSAFNVEISSSRRFAAQSYSLPRIKAIGKATGATVNDVTLAICAGALRAYLLSRKALPKKPLVAMVPVSLHAAGGEGGNQVTLLLADLGTHIADPMERLKHIVQSTVEAKTRLSGMARLQKMAHGITSIAPFGAGIVTGAAKQRPAFNLVISNVPGSREALYLNGARLDELYPVSIPTHYLALNITISGYGDQLGFGFIACRRSVPNLQRMLDHTDAAIAALEAAALPAEKPRPKPRPSARKTVAARRKPAAPGQRAVSPRAKR
jgi:diacylglycerol O-acyltransferase / wax synthase